MSTTQYETVDDVLRADPEFMAEFKAQQEALASGDIEKMYAVTKTPPSEALKRAFERLNIPVEDRVRLLWNAVEQQNVAMEQIEKLLTSAAAQAMERHNDQMAATMTAVVQQFGPISLTPEQAKAADSAKHRLHSHLSPDGTTLVYELAPDGTTSQYVN